MGLDHLDSLARWSTTYLMARAKPRCHEEPLSKLGYRAGTLGMLSALSAIETALVHIKFFRVKETAVNQHLFVDSPHDAIGASTYTSVSWSQGAISWSYAWKVIASSQCRPLSVTNS